MLSSVSSGVVGVEAEHDADSYEEDRHDYMHEIGVPGAKVD